jgi:hypothetical protein
MPLIDRGTIKSFLGKDSYVVAGDDDNPAPGFNEAINQTQAIVYQKTLVAIPEDVENANGVLQFYAHSIFAYIMSIRQKLDESTTNKYSKLYDDAMKHLDAIHNGKEKIYDSEGNELASPIQKSSSAFLLSTTVRSERL